jgi:ABC-type molybdate transport system substrate-binding protein
MNDIMAKWQRLHPELPVEQINGPAGWLRQRIEQGEPFDVYASAALEHAVALHHEGWTQAATLMVHNRLCATVATSTDADSASIVQYLLKPSTRIATSTPKMDPGGDYTWEFYRRLDDSQPGAFSALTTRSQQLYGGAPQPGKKLASAPELIQQGVVDVALGYCSGKADGKLPALKKIVLPPPAPIADYGLAVSPKARDGAAEFAKFVLSPTAQAIFLEHGFVPLSPSAAP